MPTRQEYDAAKQRQAENRDGRFDALDPDPDVLADVALIREFEREENRREPPPRPNPERTSTPDTPPRRPKHVDT